MLRQKRTTVGLLTCARSASVLTGRLAKLRGSPSTSCATRCSAGARDGMDALMRSSIEAPSALFRPAEAVAGDHGARGARPPGAGRIGARPARVRRPVVHDRLDPAPRRLLFVA